MVSVIIGTQWGDEGKGKIVDLLAQDADYVVRFHGGNNAGHTVVANGKKYPFHLIPSGILQKQAVGVIANGVIVDLEVLVSEINMLKDSGVNLQKKLIVSPRCHLIFSYHKAFDQIFEDARGKNKLGTTGRGIGPSLSDKVSYNGLRIYELLDWDNFLQKFTFQAKIKNKILQTFGAPPVKIQAELKKLEGLGKIILPFVKDTYQVLQTALQQKKNILLEGAHGVMLDLDFSPYPFSTGSNVIVGAVNTGSGIPPRQISQVWGAVKAYTSRVGGGPLATETVDATAEYIREKGQEYGTTTGRPRRIGWLDLETVKFACEVSGVTEIAITKIDVLSGLEKIKVCIDYKLNGKPISYSACGYNELAKLTPIYKDFPGWTEEINGIKRFKDLPKNCQDYIQFIEDFLRTPVKLISTGPKREDYIRIP